MNLSAEVLRDDAKRMPAVSAKTTGYGAHGLPVDTGHMLQSIQKRKTQLLAADVYANTNYSAHVHDGTSKMPARPFFLCFLPTSGGEKKIELILKQALERVVNPY